TTGTSSLTFTPPSTALGGSTFARFRLSTAGGLSPTGVATDGEVEDYNVSLTLPDKTLSVGTTGPGTGSVQASGIDCPGDCSQSYAHGTQVTLTATPDAGSTFTGWSGDCSGTGACVVTMDAARNVTAAFGLTDKTLSVATSGPGTGTVSA